MINKEIILNADGSIKKDFSDRNIPQNSNNQVSVNVLIPSACFTGLQNYAVILGVARKLNGENTYTTLNTLIMTASKSITIDGVLYIKYSAILSISYTDKIGILQLSPYIQTTAETTIGGTTTTIISIQQAFTNSQLNVIKSVLPQYDASMEEATIATTLASQIASKKIYTFIDDATSLGEHYYNLVDGFNPSVDQFKGCLVVSVITMANIDNITYVMPYLEGDDVKLLEITKDGKFYKISNVSRNELVDETYSYTREQLSYSKAEIDTNFYKKTETYNKAETDTLLNAKVDKTQKVNGHALSGDITILKSDAGIDLGNVVNYGVESTPTASGSNLYITSKGVYDALQLIYGILANMPTEEEFNAVKGRISDIETLIGDNDGDDDNVINTLKEVIATLSGLGEDANILSMINAKANQSDFNTLNSEINGTGGIKDKVDILSERNNAYTEIKNSLGTIDILVSDWASNTGDTEYPYKWELTNGYLEGAVNCIVVYSKDSDTSMLSATAGIDDENGKLIIYASELPTETISIEKIAVFNDLNAYITYSNEIVQQVLQNTSAISDINNTKLPLKLNSKFTQANSETGITYNTINDTNTGQEIKIYTKNNTYGFETDFILNGGNIKLRRRESSDYLFTDFLHIYMQLGLYHLDMVSQYIKLKAWEFSIVNESGTHELKFDNNGNLTIDGNAVGGGKQLYQHNIEAKLSGSGGNGFICINIINDNNTPFDATSIKNWLVDHNFIITDATNIQKAYQATGEWRDNANNTGAILKVGTYNNTIAIVYIRGTSINYNDNITLSSINDTIILL